MRTYKVRRGDTWQSISISQLGKTDPSDLQIANPRFHRQLDPGQGQILNIPSPERLTEADPGGGTFVSINGKRFPYWENVVVTKQMDSFSTCVMDLPFTADITAYSPITVIYNGKTLFKGTLLGPQPRYNSEGSRVTWTAYSKAGVLNDCQPLPGTNRIFYNKTLRQIAEEIIEPFGIQLEYKADDGKQFKSVERNLTTTAFNFLAEQAKLRGVFITDNPSTESAVFYDLANAPQSEGQKLEEGKSPLVTASVQFKPQSFYSEITGVLEATSWHTGADYTWKNPFLKNVLRPHVFSLASAGPGEAQSAVDAKAFRMFTDNFSVNLKVAGWHKEDGSLWKPLDTVEITVPSLLIRDPLQLTVRKVTQRQNKALLETELNCILKDINKFPWGLS